MSANLWTFCRHYSSDNHHLNLGFRRAVISAFSRFAVVGSLGFIVDALSFYSLLEWLPLSASQARVLAFFLAMITTWLGNRYFTFKGADRAQLGQQFFKHCSGSIASFVLNFIIFQCVLYLQSSIALAFAIGISVGSISNYVIAKRLVFVR